MSDRSKKQCHIINNLLTSLARDRTREILQSLGNLDCYGNDYAKKHEYYWLKGRRKNDGAARAARIFVHFSTVLVKTTT